MAADAIVLQQIEREWLQAILDINMERLDELLSTDFVYVASSHGRRNRQQWMDSIADYQFERLELSDTDIRLYGDTAVVHARIRQDATLAGQVRVGMYLITDVWIRNGERWQVVSRSSVQDSSDH